MDLLKQVINKTHSALLEAGVSLGEIALLGCGVGPGSFTGVRIGVMTAKTWAHVLGMPVAGVTAHEAVASSRNTQSKETLVVVVRAKPGYVYAASNAIGNIGAFAEPAMLPVSKLLGILEAHPEATVLGEGTSVVLEAAAIEGLQAMWKAGSALPPDASDVARCAYQKYKKGETTDPIALVPCYAAPPPIGPSAPARPAKYPKKHL